MKNPLPEKILDVVFDRIQQKADTLPPKQKRLADYILNNYKKAAFMNSTILGREAGVSESTVFRLAIVLGYPGFPEFQSALQERIQNDLTSVERFTFPNGELRRETTYARVFMDEAHNLMKVLGNIDDESFNKAVELIGEKKKVVVIGHQGSAGAASHAAYSLSKIKSSVFCIDNWTEGIFGILDDFGEEDTAWIFAFPRYPSNTVRLVKYLYEKGVSIVLVTHSHASTLGKYAEVLIPVSIRYETFLHNFAPLMCLISSVSLAVALKDKERTKKNLEYFEKFVSNTKVFSPWQQKPDE
jgi:DNA-binding MurR/RpiR family transcriptional regulator